MADVSGLAGDDRAVSVTVGYVLAIAVTTVLVAGLLVSASSFVASERKQVTRSELQVVGHQFAEEVTSADRLARTMDGGSLHVESELPETVAKQPYTITVRHLGGDRYSADLQTEDPAVNVTVHFVSQTPVETGHAVYGGRVAIEYAGTELGVSRVH